MSVAAAVPQLAFNSYSAYPAYGVSPIAAAVGYGVPQYAGVQKVVAPAVYGAQKVYGVPAVYGAQKVYAGPQVYGQVERDYNIEQLGERYAINNGHSQLQYSFVKGVDAAPYAVAQKVVAPAVYGAYGAYPNVYGAHLRTGPVVQKVDNFAVKQYIR